jgi:hypothetical protein
MSITLDCYRAAIGSWHITSMRPKHKSPKTPLTPIKIKLLLALILSSHGIFIGMLLLLQCGDVHPNPGPLNPCPYVNKSLTVCQLNVQSLYLRSETPYCRRKIDEIESILINKDNIDIICVSETWLDTQIDTSLVDIKNYTFRRKDCTNNRAGGWVCIFQILSLLDMPPS